MKLMFKAMHALRMVDVRDIEHTVRNVRRVA
jgi:hypothetical protein